MREGGVPQGGSICDSDLPECDCAAAGDALREELLCSLSTLRCVGAFFLLQSCGGHIHRNVQRIEADEVQRSKLLMRMRWPWRSGDRSRR